MTARVYTWIGCTCNNILPPHLKKVQEMQQIVKKTRKKKKAMKRTGKKKEGHFTKKKIHKTQQR